MAHFTNNRAKLTAFVLRPEGIFAKIGQIFGSADFDFSSHPAFSKSYVLQGKDEKAVRALFTPSVLSYLEAHPGWSVEAEGADVFVYRSAKRAQPEDLQQFLNDATAVSSQFIR